MKSSGAVERGTGCLQWIKPYHSAVAVLDLLAMTPTLLCGPAGLCCDLHVPDPVPRSSTVRSWQSPHVPQLPCAGQEAQQEAGGRAVPCPSEEAAAPVTAGVVEGQGAAAVGCPAPLLCPALASTPAPAPVPLPAPRRSARDRSSAGGRASRALSGQCEVRHPDPEGR